MIRMNIVSNLLGIAMAYAIGFYVTLRAIHAVDDRHHFLRGKDDDWQLAAVWPATLVVVVIASLALMLYRAATRDLR